MTTEYEALKLHLKVSEALEKIRSGESEGEAYAGFGKRCALQPYIKLGNLLEQNILTYWLSLQDPAGGFYGEVLSDGTVLPDAPRGVILNARIMWAFAAAYRQLGRPDYLAAAVSAKDWFLAHFVDSENGGVYWSVTNAGKPLDDKKQLYAQGFAIYGLSELY